MKGKSFDNNLREAIIKRLTKTYVNVIREIKYTEAFHFITENKDLSEYNSIISAECKLPQFKVLKDYIKEICKTGERQAYNYKYYRMRNLYKNYSTIFVEIGSWNNLMQYIGVCSVADKFESEREYIEPLMEYLISIISVDNKIGCYKDIILACLEDDIDSVISDIIYEVCNEKENENQ